MNKKKFIFLTMTNLCLFQEWSQVISYRLGFTFFVGCMAMMAAHLHFLLSLSQFDKKWRTSVLVSGLITFIAAVHYFYMRDYWASLVNRLLFPLC
jgi:glucan phosphoethanolaminetransferase (alkaline phosphatase superfamily)